MPLKAVTETSKAAKKQMDDLLVIEQYLIEVVYVFLIFCQRGYHENDFDKEQS